MGCHGEGVAPQVPESILPLRTVRLYETGVGYFERSGTVSGDEQASLPLPAGHLDDALKTLVVIGGNGSRTVAGVEFGSSVSRAMGRALAGLPLDADTPVTHYDMLASLKGAHVEVLRSAAHSEPLRGRVIDVLAAPPARPPSGDDKSTKADKVDEGPTVLLAGDDGAIRKLGAEEIASVRPTDPAFAARLDAALDALNANATRTPRNLRILLAGGPVTVGYVTETPVWRTTYRVVLGKGDTDPATLQGWALLHNDTDEQWRGVRVTLVNGRPDSFLFPLAAPRYARRELVTPENEASTVPQLMGRTVDAIWGDHIGDTFGAGGLGLTGIGEGGGGRGEGIGLGSIGTVGHGAGTGSATGESSLLEVGNLAGVASAQGVEAGVLFSYTLANGLDMRPHGSALVPFLGAKVDAERITWLASPSDAARAAVRLVNSTAQTLPGGPVAFFADGGFAGEGAIDRLKPKERRFLRFGADLDVELKVDRSDRKVVVKRVTFQNDSLIEHSLRTTVSDWALQNRSGTARRVYVALPIVSNATVTGADALDFDDQSNNPVAIVKLAPRSDVRRTLTSVEGVSTGMGIGALRSERLTQLLAEPDLTPPEKAAITELDKAQRALEETQKTLDKTKSELVEAGKDSDRLRELLKAAGGDKPAAGGNGGGPLMTRVLAVEDRLTALRKQLETREAERMTRLSAVRTAAEKLPAK